MVRLEEDRDKDIKLWENRGLFLLILLEVILIIKWGLINEPRKLLFFLHWKINKGIK
jgi:hypothetical protein